MPLSRLIPFDVGVVGGCSSRELASRLIPWQAPSFAADLLLVLAGTRTAEHAGISAAGATAESRRFTALADAELLLAGPAVQRRWPLPPLPAGVSPALLSHVALEWLTLTPQIAAVGLEHQPDQPHLRLEASDLGPADCVSSGASMPLHRVQRLWRQGHRLGARLRRPLVLAECVPGGTTTALGVLAGLGFEVSQWISGSGLHPPKVQKAELVDAGLARAALPLGASATAVLAAVGDPFQAMAAGLLRGVIHSGQPVLLGGGSQMLAVLALALDGMAPGERQALSELVVLGTTSWLAAERVADGASALCCLLDTVAGRYQVPLLGLSSGLRFNTSRHQELRDFEDGYVKEGVGAGGLLVLAQLRGLSTPELQRRCDQAMERLKAASVGSSE